MKKLIVAVASVLVLGFATNVLSKEYLERIPSMNSIQKEFVFWNKLYQESDSRIIRLVLRNINISEITHAIIEIGKGGIKQYILVGGKDLYKFVLVGDEFQQVEMSEVRQTKIRNFLLVKVGIRSI